MVSVRTPKTAPTSAVNPNDLFKAVECGDLDKVRQLVESQPELVDAADKAGMTALHYAASAGETEIAMFLTSMKANVNAKTKNGDTPFHMAVFARHPELAAEIRESGGVG